MFGSSRLQLFLQRKLHLCRRVTFRHVRDAFEHRADLVLDEKHYCLVRDAGPARLLRPRNICAGPGEPAAAFAQMLLERLAIARDGSQSSTRQGELGGADPSADSAIAVDELL